MVGGGEARRGGERGERGRSEKQCSYGNTRSKETFLRVQFVFRAALLLDRFLPLHVMFQTHVTSQVGSTTESGMAENAGSLVAMHFEVLGQRSKVLVNASAESARKTPWTLHHHLTSCIANMLPIASHPPCNTLTAT